MQLRNKFLLLSLLSGVLLLLAILTTLHGDSYKVYAGSARQATTAATEASATGDVARGKYLVPIGACGGCHGNAKLATGSDIPLAGGMEFNLGPLGTFYAPNLTILQDWPLENFNKVLHQGIDPEDKNNRVLAPVMPYMSFHGMSDSDVASIAVYLKSLTPVKNDVPEPKPGPVAGFALHALPDVSVPMPTINDTVDYGRYIVENISSCGDCHSPRDRLQQVIKGKELSGGGINLGTNDNPLYATPILGSVLSAEGYTRENFIIALRTGTRPWGARIPSQMPWRYFAGMTDNDLTAVWNFLQTKKLDSAWGAPASSAAATQAATASK